MRKALHPKSDIDCKCHEMEEEDSVIYGTVQMY